jgi:putative pyruvate formate lyase activating enzyme
VAGLAECRVCPRDCGVNRLENETAVCQSGRYAVVASYNPHLGEEDCLRGWTGSGTIFFSWCNLRCVFCQNFDISQEGCGAALRPDQIAEIMLRLQDMGCHNINFVTPEHVVPQLLEALPLAVERGLRRGDAHTGNPGRPMRPYRSARAARHQSRAVDCAGLNAFGASAVPK